MDLGWEKFAHAFAGGNGVIYGVEYEKPDPRKDQPSRGGRLMWHRYVGVDGAPGWAHGSGGTVGERWGHFTHVFAARDGVIYALTRVGDLLWYRHEGRNDGTFNWAARSGEKVGHSWKFKHLFSE